MTGDDVLAVQPSRRPQARGCPRASAHGEKAGRRGLFVCNVSFGDAAKIGDAPLCRFAIDAHILDENCTLMYVTALAPACILVEFSRLPLNIHCEGPCIGVVQSAL
jgi:hypothetical protein